MRRQARPDEVLAVASVSLFLCVVCLGYPWAVSVNSFSGIGGIGGASELSPGAIRTIALFAALWHSGIAVFQHQCRLSNRHKQLVVRRQQRLVHGATLHIRPQGFQPKKLLATIEQRLRLAYGFFAVEQIE